MSLVVLGLNHRTAPIEVRERFHVPEAALGRVLGELVDARAVRGCVVLSTCNRTEAYFAAADAEAGIDRVLGVLCGHAGVARRRAEELVFVHRGRAVAEHLYRVTSGLDSLVLGEPQIQGQVARAYRRAREVGGDAPGAVLHRLFQTALSAGGDVRADTRLAEGASSVPSAAVGLARKVFGSVEDLEALVVGTGKMGRLTAAVLRDQGVGRILVASRDPSRARRAAEAVGGEPVPHAGVWEAVGEVDLIVTSTVARRPLLTVDRLAVARKGVGEPLVVLDIAVPRNVEAGAGALPGIFLYNVDDLQRVVETAERERRGEVPVAEGIVRERAAEFWGWYRARRAVPAIRALRRRAEEIRHRELERAMEGLGLSEEERERLHVASRSTLNKILHGPTTALRELAQGAASADRLEMACRLLGIEPEGGVRPGSGVGTEGGEGEASGGAVRPSGSERPPESEDTVGRRDR